MEGRELRGSRQFIEMWSAGQETVYASCSKGNSNFAKEKIISQEHCTALGQGLGRRWVFCFRSKTWLDKLCSDSMHVLL